MKPVIIFGIVVVLLAMLTIVLLTYVLALKSQMRKATKELEKTMDYSYNKQLTIQLFDKDLTKLTTAFNKNLEYQKKLKLEAEQSQIQLKQSVSDIAHDLRTPVTVIKGNLQMLDMESELSAKEKEYITICKNKTDVLKSMIDDFFELSFMESEEMEVNLSKVDLTDFAVQFLVDHEALIRENHLEPEIVLPEKSIFIMADRQLLLRMFGNLLSNIITHTQDTFSLVVTEVGEEIIVRFSNPVNSGNLPDVEHIFDRTYRGNKARTGGGPGGLGLYIVKLLAGKQNARVQAKCENNRLIIETVFKVDCGHI